MPVWEYIPKRRQRQFYFLFMLMLLASVTEVISVGAVLPFIAALTAPEQIFQHDLMQPLIQILKIMRMYIH